MICYFRRRPAAGEAGGRRPSAGGRGLPARPERQQSGENSWTAGASRRSEAGEVQQGGGHNQEWVRFKDNKTLDKEQKTGPVR